MAGIPPPAPPIGAVVVGQRAPVEFEWVTNAVITRFKQIQPLFATADEFDYGWWYRYFWKEVKGANAADAEFKKLIDMIYDDPQTVIPPGTLPGPRRTLLDQAGLAVLNNAPAVRDTDFGRKRRILGQLLKMGFREMQPTLIYRSPDDTQKFFSLQIRHVAQPGGRACLSFGFRGEGRPFATVIQHQGAQNRVDLGLCNMNQPWHPFSERAVGGKMYFRKTSGDNCLYSVTSVASDPEVNVGFPLIEDENIYTLPAGKAFARWNRAEWNTARVPGGTKQSVVVAKVRVVHQGRLLPGYALGTVNYLYLFKVKGTAVHTQEELGGDQCRERGVREIPMADFVAGVKLHRIHFGSTRGHGLAGFVQDCKYYVGGPAWNDNPTDQEIAQFHFDGDLNATARFRELFAQHFQTPTSIQGEILVDPKPDYKIHQILQWDVPYDDYIQDKRNPEVVFIA